MMLAVRATAFAVLGSLYDSRQIKKLDLGSLVLDATRDSCQSSELVGGNLTVHACQVAQ